MYAVTERSPFSESLNLPSLMSDPFDGLIPAFSDNDRWNPAVDISEDDKSFKISADLPDVKKEDIDVSVENGYLTISGERHHESEEENPEKTFHRIERNHGSFLRRFALPDRVDADK